LLAARRGASGDAATERARNIALLDLVIFLPATVLACVDLVRGAAWAQKALYAIVGRFDLVGPVVAAMAIMMYVEARDRAVEPPA
jgi:hypothetical protein